MTQQERIKIASIISGAIKENGPQGLKHIPGYLAEGGVPKSAYGALKKCLATFPEFFVFGTSGYETVDFSTSALSKFYNLLTSRIPYQLPATPISLLAIVELLREAGLDAKKYASLEDAQELLKVYPAYQVRNIDAPAATTETDYIQSLVYVNWRQISNKIQQYVPAANINPERVRENLVSRFSKALLDGSGLLLDAAEEETPRVAFETGYRTSAGEKIYCIFQPNTKDSNRQAWMAAGVVYPNEQDSDGLGAWLAQRFFANTKGNTKAIRQQVEELLCLREQLLPDAAALLEALQTGMRTSPMAAQLGKYESGWQKLTQDLAQHPSFADSYELSLLNIAQIIETDNEQERLEDRARDLFTQIFESVRDRLKVLQAAPPAQDLERALSLLSSVDALGSAQQFRELIHPYLCLYEVLKAKDRVEVHDSTAVVSKHFGIPKLDVLEYLLGGYSHKYAALELLEDLQHVLEAYGHVVDTQEEIALAPMDVDVLEEEIFACKDTLPRRWIGLYRALMPQDAQLRGIILPDAADTAPGEPLPKLTPSHVADRLLAACGNQDRLAEQYLLLGLLMDRSACVPRLLGLYRNNGDEDRFLRLWESDYRKSDFTAQDVCFWISIDRKSETLRWKEIEEFVTRYPEIKKTQEYQRTILHQMDQAGQQPAAYLRWIGINTPQLNELETAIAGNDLEAVYILLADADKMRELGYEQELAQQIQQAVSAGLPGGSDIYGKAARLYCTQKNKNGSAECLLWSAPLTSMVMSLLFDIYSEEEDYPSVAWLTQKFSVPMDTLARAAVYAKALAKTEQTSVRSDWMMQHPELWHRSELLEGLEGDLWEPIYQRELANPIPPINPFVQALIEDDLANVEAMLADAEKMAQWGYTEDMVQSLKERLQTAVNMGGTDRASVVARIKHYQGNLHRNVEAYLYQQFDASPNWAIQQLYTLAFAEGRYVDAAQYYNTRSLLTKAASNVCTYMWCLVHMGEADKLFELAQLRPESLRTDAQLVKAVLELAKQKHEVEFSENLQHMIDRLPQNPFEAAVMQVKREDMEKYVSDPDLLTALGYSAESIARFKDRLSKPLPTADNGYALADRMRMFFGNERAIPFLIEAQADPRAAKLLLEIYVSCHNWDAVCALYRSHLPNGIWNATYAQRYLDALSKSHAYENCCLYLAFLQSEENADQTSAAYQWKYLRSLIGAKQEEAAMVQMNQILARGTELVFEVLLDLFDLVWEVGSDELRQQTALFAAQIYLERMSSASLDQRKAILSLNGNLIREEDPQKWRNLFEQRGLKRFSTFLMCYFNFGVGQNPQHLQETADVLFALLDDPQEQDKSGVLTAVTNFALENELLIDDNGEKRDKLLSCWLAYVLTSDEDQGRWRLDSLTDLEFSALLALWNKVTLTDVQIHNVLQAFLGDEGSVCEWTSVSLRRIGMLLNKLQDNTVYTEQYANKIVAAFTSWFVGQLTENAESIKTAAVFLQSIQLDYQQMQAFLHTCVGCDMLYDAQIKEAILAGGMRQWPDLHYRYLQALYFKTEQEEQQDALSQAKVLLCTEQFEIALDNDALRFAYEIVCMDPTTKNLHLLHELYSKAGKNDYAQILLQMEAANAKEADENALRTWFVRILDQHPIEWIEYYAQWWAPLISIREADNQTKSVISYLTNDASSMKHRHSVLRLLLSDIRNSVYISCYLRLEKELSPVAYAKLTVIRARNDSAFCADAIRECLAKKQYLYAVTLLTSEIKPIPANAVFIGQMAGEIYTAESVRLCPELGEHVQSMYRQIIKLNKADPGGAWKNIGRAVDIAVLTNKESLFLDIFNQEYQNVYYAYSGKCAALIANLILRQEFATAHHYLEESQGRNRSDPYLYMALLDDLIECCMQEGVLSEENEILARSIPVSGNMRSLELYGSLVHYALQKQSIQACARAFYKLRKYAVNDKALLACCIQLYSVMEEELSVKELYTVANSYLEIVQDGLLARTGRVMAVVSACSGEEIDDWQLLSDCQNRIFNDDVLSDIKNLRKECVHFLEAADGRGEKMRFLLRAATGWWKIDVNTLQYFDTAESLCGRLADLYPSAFYSACIAGALRYRADTPIREKIISLFGLRGYKWGREQAAVATQYPDDVCEKIIRMTDSPIDLPGMYTKYLQQVLNEPEEDSFKKQMMTLLVIQKNFQFTQFEDNMYGLRELSEACPNARRYELSRIVLRKTVRSSDVLALPRQYIDAGEYEMAAISAEKQLETSNIKFYVVLNQTYLELSRFMTGGSLSQKYTLLQLMNMATLLSQSNSYGDMQKLLDSVPARWKLCLRSVQEFIQGNPANILYLLSDPDFQTHEGCYMFVYSMVRNYQGLKDWEKTMKEENQRYHRLPSWGRCDLSKVKAPAFANKEVLIRAQNRNFAELEPYKQFVDKCLAEMRKHDSKSPKALAKNQSEQEPEEIKTAVAEENDGEEIWTIPVIAEILKKDQETESTEDALELDTELDLQEPGTDGNSREKRKNELIKALSSGGTNAETVEIGRKLLPLLWQEPVTAKTKEYCVDFCLALYCEKRERRGMVVHVTEEARNILYSMVPCLKGITNPLKYSAELKVHVQQCLGSYQNLSQLTADCMSDSLMDLCAVIGRGDREVAGYLRSHIRMIRGIGKKMLDPMTNAERLNWLQERVVACRNSSEHPFMTPVKMALINMLNREILEFRNKARVHLNVYNSECIVGNGCIFGKVENLGREPVTKLVLSLTVNDVFTEQCTLPALAGSEMVPFALPCGNDEEAESISYKLSLRYVTQDGEEETATPIEGVLTFQEADGVKHRLQRYDASNPADGGDYIERASISTTLEANYLVDGGFKRFPNFAIYGMKRSGKSSVLRRLGRMLNENYPEQVRHVIVSCEGITGDFYARAHTVFVKYVLDELEHKFDLQRLDGWQEFCNAWEEQPEAKPDFRWLDSFYTALSRRWLPDVGLIIMIDEIERLYFDLDEGSNYLDEDTETSTARGVDDSNAQTVLWDVINKVTQRDGSQIRFVLCGSDFFTSKIIAEGDNLTQFFQKGVKLNVDRMEYEEIKAALCSNSSVTLHEDTIDYLWDIAAGLPWHSKIFCNSVIENQLIRKDASTRSVIYPSDIQDAIDLILSTTKDIASPANFGLLSLSEEEELLVHTLAEVLDSRLTKISQEELLERVCMVARDQTKGDLYAKALRSLVNERKLLRIDKGRNYQFGCELYRMYLRHELPSRFI